MCVWGGYQETFTKRFTVCATNLFNTRFKTGTGKVFQMEGQVLFQGDLIKLRSINNATTFNGKVLKGVK